MTWDASTPNGSISVSANKTKFVNNYSYIETQWQKDHHFDDSNANLDGHHKQIEMPSNSSVPALSTDMTSGFTTVENTYYTDNASTTNDIAVYEGKIKDVTTGTSHPIQLLPVLAWGTFSQPAGGTTVTDVNMFNLNSQMAFIG